MNYALVRVMVVIDACYWFVFSECNFLIVLFWDKLDLIQFIYILYFINVFKFSSHYYTNPVKYRYIIIYFIQRDFHQSKWLIFAWYVSSDFYHVIKCSMMIFLWLLLLRCSWNVFFLLFLKHTSRTICTVF